MKIQTNKPIRNPQTTYANYTSYKKVIRKDFWKRCGYCDDSDKFHGGYRGYQIDHFKPHSIPAFSHLKQTYTNLVYSCPFCNRAKSNKWKTHQGFIDPCDPNYDNHLCRDNKGKIQFITMQGKYIYENLNFHLIRHELLWMIEKLEKQSEMLSLLIDYIGEGHDKEVLILREFHKIEKEIKRYNNLFQNEI